MSEDRSHPGVFHIGQLRLTSVSPLTEYGDKVCLGLILEEFFQFLYLRTSVTEPFVLRTGFGLHFLSKEINVFTPETFLPH